MTPFRARLLSFAVIALMLGVAVNAHYFQGPANHQAWKQIVSTLPGNAPGSALARTDRVRPTRNSPGLPEPILPALEEPRLSVAGAPAPGRILGDRTPATLALPKPAGYVPARQAMRQPRPFIRVIQRQLAARGYDPGPVDGIAGAKTRAAIMAFENDQSIRQTGEASESLLLRLLSGAPGPSARVKAKANPEGSAPS